MTIVIQPIVCKENFYVFHFQTIFLNLMEDDEDDFFAYQTAKSLNNKRTQLKQFFQA